jgi:hypothetical protein
LIPTPSPFIIKPSTSSIKQSTLTHFSKQSHFTTKMSAPNLDKPNEGIVGQISNSIGNAVNYATETLQGNASEAKKEAHKEQAKGNVGDTSLTGRASGALNAAGDKLDQHKHETAAEANKHAI